MSKISEKEKLYIIMKAILMSKDYRDCFQKYQDTKDKARDIKDMSNHMAWYEIVSRWGFIVPIDPTTDVKKISPNLLKQYFQQGGVSFGAKEHRQYYGADKVSPTIDITIDLTQYKTKILRDVEKVVVKLQKLRREQGDNIGKKVPGKGEDSWNYSLKDFVIYERYNKERGKNKDFTFYQMARKQLGDNTTDIEAIDLEAKKMKNAYNRAKWLMEGGYEVIKRKI